jgi:hypothetical protein
VSVVGVEVVEVVDDVVELVVEVVEEVVVEEEPGSPVVEEEVVVRFEDVPVSSVLEGGVSPQPIKRDRMEKYIMG